MNNPKNILLLEDDAEMRVIMAKFLFGGNWTLHEADTEARAMAIIETGISFDLAIIDFWLGAGNAVTVMDKLQDVPKLIISGGSDKMDLEKTQAIADISGAVKFLQKPFKKHELLASVETALNVA